MNVKHVHIDDRSNRDRTIMTWRNGELVPYDQPREALPDPKVTRRQINRGAEAAELRKAAEREVHVVSAPTQQFPENISDIVNRKPMGSTVGNGQAEVMTDHPNDLSLKSQVESIRAAMQATQPVETSVPVTTIKVVDVTRIARHGDTVELDCTAEVGSATTDLILQLPFDTLKQMIAAKRRGRPRKVQP